MNHHKLAALIVLIGLLCFNIEAFGDSALYCPTNHSTIHIGMNQTAVIAACGEPQDKGTSNTPLVQRVPITQLVFNDEGIQTIQSGNGWAIPVSNGGGQLEVDIMNDKVYAIRLNGNSSNAASICVDGTFNIGSPVSAVYDACGNPATTNVTYMNMVDPSQKKPETWTYQFNPYQSPIRLTFINGQLQSIN
jgi:hypothetical protein